VKQVQVPINGGPDQNHLDGVMRVLMGMGPREIAATSLDEASRPGYKREGTALIVTVPDDMPMDWVRRMVDHALSDLKVLGQLTAGDPIALE